MMMAPSEQDLLLQAVSDFRQHLHLKMPLSRLRHFTEFYSEPEMEEQSRLVKTEVRKKFMESISHLSDERSTDLFNDLNVKIRAFIDELNLKNEDHKKKCEAFFKERIDNICEDCRMTMEGKLLMNPELDMEAMGNLLDEVIIRGGLSPFEMYRQGNVIYFEEQKRKLNEKLYQLKMEMLEKHGQSQAQALVLVQPPSDHEARQLPVNQDENDESDPEMEARPATLTAPEEENDATTESCASESHSLEPIIPKMEIDHDQDIAHLEVSNANVISLDEATSQPSSGSGSGGKKRKLGIPIKNKNGPGPGPSTAEKTSKRSKQNESVILTPGTGTSAVKATATTSRSENESSTATSTVVAANSSKRIKVTGNAYPTIPKTPSRFPLIFRLSTNSVSMGSKAENGFERFPCQNGELSMPPVLGVDENEFLVCGLEAEATTAISGYESWNLQQFLFGNSPEGKASFLIGYERISQDMTLEFLLGYLLKTLKLTAESHKNKTFGTAVITLPLWLTSRHRIEIKDAGKIAGFSEVHLINQEAVASWALLSKRLGEQQKLKKCDVLVFAENFGILSAALYRYRMNTKDLEMTGDHHLTIDGEADKKKMFRDVRSSLFAKVGMSSVMKYIFLTDSLEWMEVFSGEQLKNEGEGAEALFGCSLLCGDIVNEMYENVVEYLPSPGGLSLLEEYKSQEKTGLEDEVEFVKLPMENLFQNGGYVKLLQGNVQGKVELGQVVFNGVTKYTEEYYNKAFANCKMDLVFYIGAEGIVSFDEEGIKVTMTKRNKNDKEELRVEDFSWTTFKMEEEEKERVKKIVNQIISQNRIRRN